MKKLISLIIPVLLLFLSCGEDNKNDSGISTQTITIGPSVAWMNTGIVLKKGDMIEMSSGDTALGALYVRPNDPLSTSRHGGLIGKLGVDERPFWIGTHSVITVNSINQGKTLLLGRNDTDFLTYSSGPLAFQPLTMTVNVTVAPNSQNSIALVSPLNGSYSSDGSPVFDWDDVDNTLQYRLQLSQFPDFRVVEQDINTVTSTQNPFAAPPGSSVQPLSPLAAGVHYWRVRAYVNVGRVTAPVLEWGDWSQVFSYGVETLGIPPTPTVINPAQGEKFSLGDPVLCEFIAAPLGSGLLWSYLFTYTTCGNTPSTTAFTTADGSPYPWYVFPRTVEPADPNQVPPSYASFTDIPSEKGEWLYRIETRAGSDFNAAIIDFFDVRFSVGCP